MSWPPDGPQEQSERKVAVKETAEKRSGGLKSPAKSESDVLGRDDVRPQAQLMYRIVSHYFSFQHPEVAPVPDLPHSAFRLL